VLRFLWENEGGRMGESFVTSSYRQSCYKSIKKRGAGGLSTSWAKSPDFSVFPASPSPNKLIGSSNPGHDGGLVGRRILPTLGRR